MYLVHTPQWIQRCFPQLTWRIPTHERNIYLTFDDGPIPDVTPWVLEQLAQYDARATFFCVGENIRRHPLIFEQVISAGHRIGSHTHNHLNGWATRTDDYIANVHLGAVCARTTLFRPPYGRLTPAQLRRLQRCYQIVMWDVLSGDFDPQIRPQDCLDNVLNTYRAGSIIVLHDSLKAQKNLMYVLPRLLAHWKKNGFRLLAL
ncbi:MAG: polysaccharide deacetylase family protein [Bacteroidota bacterium]